MLDRDVGKAADPAQRVADDLFFPRQLRGISKMLDLAAAAGAENGAERLRAQADVV